MEPPKTTGFTEHLVTVGHLVFVQTALCFDCPPALAFQYFSECMSHALILNFNFVISWNGSYHWYYQSTQQFKYGK